mmetsp:Transcript_140883/g.245276  ORF Transcript_140883/g.245276 Transcript_140883/m.245276 type:complete len:615 (-) Transcript_140883:362-2206(-)
MSRALASHSQEAQLQLPMQSVTSSISEWLDDSIRVGHGERFAGAFKLAGVENLSDLHHIDMAVVEKYLKDAGAKLIQLKQIREVVDKALSCPSSVQRTPSSVGSRLCTPSLAACKTPSGMLDLQSPMASFFGENCNGFRSKTPRVSFGIEQENKSLPSPHCKTPKTTYFDENCNALRPCKSPMSAFFDGDGDNLSFNMDLQPLLSVTPTLLSAQVQSPPSPQPQSGTPPLPPAAMHAPPSPEPQFLQAFALPTLLPATKFSGQSSSPMQICNLSAQDVMQQQLHQMSIAWTPMMQAAERVEAVQKQKTASSASQHRSRPDDLKRRHGDSKLQRTKTSVPAAPKLLQHAQTANLDREVAEDISSLPVLGNVRRLSQDPTGCWRVQTYIEEAAGEPHCLALAAEFRGHISEAATCPHANHVLRKLINTLSPQSLQLLIDELVEEGPETMLTVARHRYGCRIIEGLIVQCAPEQMQPVVDLLFPHAYDLCMHMYGNFIVQRLFECSTESVRQGIFRLLQVHLSSLGTNFYGSSLIGTCMKHADADEKLAIARALISVNGLLAALARFKHGKAAANCILGLLSGEELKEAHHQLREVTPLKAEKSKNAAARAAAAAQS